MNSDGLNMANNSNSFLEYSCETTMSEEEVLFLQKNLRKSKNYLEFGSGFSTIEACKYVKENIVSVETSPQYIDFLKEKINDLTLDGSKVKFLHADIGETGVWGHPTNQDSIKTWPNYGIVFRDHYQLVGTNPDLALIDGRFRVATFLRLYLTCPGLKIIFDDYFDRPQYHIVESLIPPKERVGRIAVFRIPRKRKMKDITLAIEALVENLLNPE